jgi:hypothetical protein
LCGEERRCERFEVGQSVEEAVGVPGRERGEVLGQQPGAFLAHVALQLPAGGGRLDEGGAPVVRIGRRCSSPASSSLPTMRDIIVGLMPSNSASSVIRSGPSRAAVASTEAWVPVMVCPRDCRSSTRVMRARAMRSRATSSASMSATVTPWNSCLLASI